MVDVSHPELGMVSHSKMGAIYMVDYVIQNWVSDEANGVYVAL